MSSKSLPVAAAYPAEHDLLESWPLSPKARRFVGAAIDRFGISADDEGSVIRAVDRYRQALAGQLADPTTPEDEQADLENDILYLDQIRQDLVRHIGKVS